METQFQNDLVDLEKNGFRYEGERKKYIGLVDLSPDGKWKNVTDACGYYRKDDGGYCAFITEHERGIPNRTTHCATEEEAQKQLVDWMNAHNLINLREDGGFSPSALCRYLNEHYGYDKTQTEQALQYLAQDRAIATEFAYYARYGKYVPEQYITTCEGYTVKRLKEETKLSMLGAFNYMVYLRRKPAEALEQLKNGLPAL